MFFKAKFQGVKIKVFRPENVDMDEFTEIEVNDHKDIRSLRGYEAKNFLNEIPEKCNIPEYIYNNYHRIQGGILLKKG